MNEHLKSSADPEKGESKALRQKEEDPSTIGQQAGRPSLLERLAGMFRHRNGSNLRENLADALAEDTSEETDFSAGERAMLNNILRFREVRVEDVMIPRANIEAVEISTTLGDLLNMFEQSGHSRLPVFHENLDDPRGMLHIRDVLGHITKQAQVKKSRGGRKPVTVPVLDLAGVDLARSIGELNLVRPVLFVPPSMLASDLMARMQAAHIQMALVIDEYGGTDGLVSLEDIVEMVVGDIEDEHDEDELLITRLGDGVFVVDGKAEIEDVAKVIGDAFKPGEHGETVDTIGGMILNTLGRVPDKGEIVHAIPGFEFHVLDADPRRVKSVRIVSDQNAEHRRRAAQMSAGEEQQD